MKEPALNGEGGSDKGQEEGVGRGYRLVPLVSSVHQKNKRLGHFSDCHLHRNLLVGLVSGKLKVLEREPLDVDVLRVYLQRREGPRLVLQLLPERLHVVAVHMRIAQRVHKVTRLEAAHVGYDAGEEGVGRGPDPPDDRKFVRDEVFFISV